MLPPRLAEAFEAIRTGGTFPFGWLATVAGDGQPRVRTVKVMGFNLVSGLFYLASNSYHDKLAHLRHDPRAELCLADLAQSRQLRLTCRARLQSGGAEASEREQGLRERFWQKLSPRTKIEMYGGHPQQPKPPDSFVVLHLEAIGAELLDLNASPPLRIRYHTLSPPYHEESLRP